MKRFFFAKLNSVYLTSLFCLAVFMPFLGAILTPGQLVSEQEKRNLIKIPEFPRTIQDVVIFPGLFEKYYSDHFGFRNWLASSYKLVKYTIGDSPVSDVIRGKNGWLFLGSTKKNYTKYGDPIGDYRGLNLYTNQQLKELSDYFKSLTSWLKDQEIEYILLITPGKHTIYSDQLPEYITKINNKTATDQLIEYLRQHTNITIIHPRDILLKEKKKGQLFYKTDTHWNSEAANLVQYQVLSKIKEFFPGKVHPQLREIKILKKGTESIENFITNTKKLLPGITQSELLGIAAFEENGGDLANLIGLNISSEPYLQPLFQKTCTPVSDPPSVTGRETNTVFCENESPTALVFRDSFFSALQPFFSRELSRTTYIWDKLKFPTLLTYVHTEKPAIVIEQWAERTLPYLPEEVDQFYKFLNQRMFEKSSDIIFSNKWEDFDIVQQLKKASYNSKFIELFSLGKDPILRLRPLPLNIGQKYVVHLRMHSSINSELHLYYSDATSTGYPFSEQRSKRVQVDKGENDIYFFLDFPSLGSQLRLDPISGVGRIIIKTFEIKKVKKMS